MISNPCEDFELIASPPHWLEIADDLNDQAHVLKSACIGDTRYTDHRGVTTVRPRTNRGVFLLAGFALENLLKSYLIFEYPHFIANGMLAKDIRTHRLTQLRSMSSLVPHKRRYSSVFSAFEEGLESWARYPSGLRHDSPAFERAVTPRLWLSYNAAFKTHRDRLRTLLSAPWQAPSGAIYRMRYE